MTALQPQLGAIQAGERHPECADPVVIARLPSSVLTHTEQFPFLPTKTAY